MQKKGWGGDRFYNLCPHHFCIYLVLHNSVLDDRRGCNICKCTWWGFLSYCANWFFLCEFLFKLMFWSSSLQLWGLKSHWAQQQNLKTHRGRWLQSLIPVLFLCARLGVTRQISVHRKSTLELKCALTPLGNIRKKYWFGVVEGWVGNFLAAQEFIHVCCSFGNHRAYWGEWWCCTTTHIRLWTLKGSLISLLVIALWW